jgi:hypothetical protein
MTDWYAALPVQAQVIYDHARTPNGAEFAVASLARVIAQGELGHPLVDRVAALDVLLHLLADYGCPEVAAAFAKRFSDAGPRSRRAPK